MAVRNSTGSTKNQLYKRESKKRPKNNRPNNSSGRVKSFNQGHLKNCTALGEICKNCGKPNHFAKLCRFQQVSEVAEDSGRSEEECDLIRESFGSCNDFDKKKSIQPHQPEAERISKYVVDRINKNNRQIIGKKVRFQKIDLLRDPTSNKVKSQRPW